jgi:hypothetical protein
MAARGALTRTRRSTQQRSSATRRKITKALKEMRKKGLAINPHALANYAGVARKSIYNHRDLLDQIRAETPQPHRSTGHPTRRVTTSKPERYAWGIGGCGRSRLGKPAPSQRTT